MKYNHIFGPVPSRRFGLSLGVDLVPFKTCTFNCIYCECGRTTNPTLEKKEYVDIDEIILELKDFLVNDPRLDYITLTGSGEPTLNTGIGRLALFLKNERGRYKTALLTNGTLLYDDEIVEAVKTIDVIKATLNASSDMTLMKINRPVEGITIRKILDGIKNLRKKFTNQIWIELFIIPGINDEETELIELKKEFLDIKPDIIQLNSLDRPGAFNEAAPADQAVLEKVKEILRPLPVEIISRSAGKMNGILSGPGEFILSVIKRRPSTVEDIMNVSGLSLDVITGELNRLKENHKVIEKKMSRGFFYFIR